MLRFLGILAFSILVSLGASFSSARAHFPASSCDRTNGVYFNTEVAVRNSWGDFIKIRKKGDCVPISLLRRGFIKKHGFSRWWAGNDSSLQAITSRNGFILSVDPSDHLRALFAKEGVVLPPLPEGSIKVTITLSEPRFPHLRVRSGPDTFDYSVVDNVYHGQEIWITDAFFLKGQNITFVWGKVYSLYRGGETWALLGFLRRVGNRVHRHIGEESWGKLILRYPELVKEVSRLGN